MTDGTNEPSPNPAPESLEGRVLTLELKDTMRQREMDNFREALNELFKRIPPEPPNPVSEK